MNYIQKRTLNTDIAPSQRLINMYRRCGLAVDKDTNGATLQFLPDLNYGKIDKKLRTLFPNVFTYLDNESPVQDGQVQWVLALKSGHTGISIVTIEEPNGEDIMNTRRPMSKNYAQQTVYFGEPISRAV